MLDLETEETEAQPVWEVHLQNYIEGAWAQSQEQEQWATQERGGKLLLLHVHSVWEAEQSDHQVQVQV